MLKRGGPFGGNRSNSLEEWLVVKWKGEWECKNLQSTEENGEKGVGAAPG
jgi:hypothetical protein